MNTFSGVLEDTRSEEEKQKDFRAEELVASTPVKWEEKKELKKYPIWSQGRTGSCVAFSRAKQVSIEVYNKTGVWLDYSPAFIYQRRGYERGGMSIPKSLDIVKKEGTTLEAFMPSQCHGSDAEIDAVPEIAIATAKAQAIEPAVNAYVYINNDIDSIARVLDKHPVGLTIYASTREYTDTPRALDEITYQTADIRHEVVAVDYFLDPELGKCLWIEDSWGVGTGQGGRRIFTEGFLHERLVLACYFEHFDFDYGQTDSVSFSKSVQYGQTDSEVFQVQNFLRSKGHFPNINATGYYGEITRRAVLAWQLETLTDISETQLREWSGRYWGPASIKKANEIISNQN